MQNDAPDFGNSDAPNHTLLGAKLYTPPPCRILVARRRLMEALSKTLTSSLTLVSAPAGYGKTTLVSSWLREVGVPATWLSLDGGDNDPIRFLQYFISALRKIVPAIPLDLLSALQGMQPTAFEALLNILINEIAGHALPFVFVLDDFHTIHARPVVEMIAYLLDHAPPTLHLMLLSRSDPPLPLSRLRVRGQLVDIRADQLRFTREEAASFLNEAMGLKVPGDAIVALEAKTEGWIAGLQLAAISMQGRADVRDFVSAFSGSHHYIVDYLAEEALGLQTETIRAFLLQSSVLDRMCGALCDDVVNADHDGPANGQATLEALEQMNMFIIPLDRERRWYRYHRLFGEVLNRRLEQLYPNLVPDLHRRASRWYERSGFVFDAIRHSLAAGDVDRAALLLDQHGCLLLMRGEVINLLHWIEAVEPYSQTFPWIAIQKAWALCLAGRLDQAEIPLQTAERLIAPLPAMDDQQVMRGAIRAARAYRANRQGDAHLAADLARQTLDCLPVTSDFSCSLRSVATSILGDASCMEGNLAEAQRAYTDAAAISQATANPYVIIIAHSNLADVLMEQGRLRQAAGLYTDALRVAVGPDGKISPLADWAYGCLGRISLEWNHLEDAENYAQQCIELARCWGRAEAQALGYLVLAGVEQARDKVEAAREAMRRAEPLIGEHTLTPWRSTSLKANLARLWAAQGDMRKVAGLMQSNGIPLGDLPQDGSSLRRLEPLYPILLLLYLAQDRLDDVLAVGQKLLQRLDGTDRAAQVIQILVIQALALQRKNNTDQALVVLEQALSLAEPDGYVRAFLDHGEPMARLLYQAKSRLAGAGYAAELLSALGHAAGRALPNAEMLIEPLTAREVEVLKLIEAGYSNQEIAAGLVISIPTVKRHISNIYTKLGANSRTQAISRGKELQLFP